jgi:hypothetical protein
MIFMTFANPQSRVSLTRPAPQGFLLALLLGCVAMLAACSSAEPQTRRIIVPTTATSVPQYRGNGTIPEEKYVIRMSDGSRDWEVSFPATATGYQVRIPLESGPPSAGPAAVPGLNWRTQQLTAADKELLKELRRQNPDMEREGVYVDGQNVLDREAGPRSAADGEHLFDDEAAPAPTRPSYLLGITEVQKLFERGHYELAMVRLSQLDKAYPNDAKILAMKGTLWKQLGRPALARKAWEQVLHLDPDNKVVLEALKNLNATTP